MEYINHFEIKEKNTEIFVYNKNNSIIDNNFMILIRESISKYPIGKIELISNKLCVYFDKIMKNEECHNVIDILEEYLGC